MGAGNILSLLFEINADPTNAQDAIRKFRDSSLANLGSFGAGVQGALGSVVGPASIALGAITGVSAALFEMAQQAAEVAHQIGKASEVTGISGKALSGLRVISGETHESFETLSASLGRAGRNITIGLVNPSSQAGQILKALFTEAQVQSLQLVPVEQRIQTVVKRIFELNDEGERNLALSAFLGRGWQTNIETLKILGDQGYAPAIQKAKALGQLYGPEEVRKAEAFDAAWADMKLTFSSVALEIGTKVIPAFTELFRFTTGGKETILSYYGALAAGGPILGTNAILVLKAKDAIVGKNMAEVSATAVDAQFRESTRAVADQVMASLKPHTSLIDALKGQKKAKEDDLWQTDRLISALREYTGVSRSLQVQLDSGTSPALRRYLEVEQKLADLALKLDVSMLRRQNLLLYQKQVTEELANAHIRLADRLQTEARFNDVLARQIPVLTEEERRRLPLIYDETNALARMLQNSRAVVDEMMLGELPARQRINIMIDRQIAAADREIAKYRELALTHQITRAEMEAAEVQYTAAVESLQQQREEAQDEETMNQINAVVMQGVALLQVLGYRKAAAIVEAVWETAQGFAALATGNFWSAAQHFLAAATYGVIAGQSSKSPSFNASVSSAMGGGAATGAAGGAPPQLAPGAASAAAREAAQQGQQGTTIIIQDGGSLVGVQGDFLSMPQTIDQLASHLTKAVEQRDVRLLSSGTMRSAPAVR